MLRENGDKSYSLLIEKIFKDDEPYSVENLNVLSEKGDYKVLMTKWIPLDGKPFYDVEKFIGELQYLDLNGNLLHSLKIGIKDKTAKSNQTAKSQFEISLGCWTYDIIFCGCSDSPYKIVSSSYTCGSGGGGTTSGTTTSGGATSTGSTTGTSSSGSGGISSGGTTVYNGTGTTTFVPNIPTEDEVEKKMYNTFLTTLTKDQYNLLGYYPAVNQDIFNYLADNNFASANKLVAKKMINSAFISYNLGTNASIEFVEWGSNYLIQNPTVTYLQFQNWFMGQSEGKDGDEIIDLNNVLNTLSYQIRSLPTYTNFENNFPKLYWPEYPYYYQTMSAKSVYSIVGGNLESLYINDPSTYRNACAVRISLAFNKIGISIPNNAVTRQGATVNGVAQNYFLQAISVNNFMIKTFGDTTYKLEGADANDKTKIAKLLEGKYGIYVIVNNSSTTAGYTGHADLIKNGYVIGGANTAPKGGIKSIRIWVLNN